jgi:hypothetical protein
MLKIKKAPEGIKIPWSHPGRIFRKPHLIGHPGGLEVLLIG